MKVEDKGRKEGKGCIIEHGLVTKVKEKGRANACTCTQ